jgi:hypothetical protein
MGIYENIIDIFLFSSLLLSSLFYVYVDLFSVRLKPTFIATKINQNIHTNNSIIQTTKFIGNDFELISKLYILKGDINLLNNIDGKYCLRDIIYSKSFDDGNPYMVKMNRNYSNRITPDNLMLSLTPKDLSNINLPLFDLTTILNTSKQERFLVKNSYMDVDMIYNNQGYVSMKKLLGNGVSDIDAKNNI